MRRVADWATVLLLLGLVMATSYQFWEHTPSPPAVFTRVEAMNSPVPQGHWLDVRIYREKTRDCPVESIRWAMDQNGRVTDVPDAAWSGGPVGTDYLDFSYDVRHLDAGSYELGVILRYRCPDRVYRIDQPPVRFIVQ